MASWRPGMPSSAKRAPTSAMRPAPLVMTMKFTIISTQKITTPSSRLPSMMKLAKPSITCPAASVPVWPCPMISLVDETFSERRSSRLASRMVGKAEKSSGRSMNSATVSIRIASAKDRASPMSSIQAGTGSTIMAITAISASASRMVGWNTSRMVTAGKITARLRSGRTRPRPAAPATRGCPWHRPATAESGFRASHRPAAASAPLCPARHAAD